MASWRLLHLVAPPKHGARRRRRRHGGSPEKVDFLTKTGRMPQISGGKSSGNPEASWFLPSSFLIWCGSEFQLLKSIERHIERYWNYNLSLAFNPFWNSMNWESSPISAFAVLVLISCMDMWFTHRLSVNLPFLAVPSWRQKPPILLTNTASNAPTTSHSDNNPWSLRITSIVPLCNIQRISYDN